jgi:hypothetical protein
MKKRDAYKASRIGSQRAKGPRSPLGALSAVFALDVQIERLRLDVRHSGG